MTLSSYLPPAVIVDVDGTLSIRDNRSPFDWSRVSEDSPNEPIVVIVKALAAAGLEIIVVSGREDTCQTETQEWLDLHLGFSPPLLMRTRGDYRPDYVIKEELYRNHIEFHWDVIAVLDDRQQTVDLWRRLNLTTLQVAEGSF